MARGRFWRGHNVHSWTNTHKIFTQTLADQISVRNPTTGTVASRYKRTTKSLQEIIAYAQKKDLRLRALGSGWSWTKIAVSEGLILNTYALNMVLSLHDHHVSPSYRGLRRGLKLVQSGILISDLNRVLRRHRLSLPTSGASNGQTLAGASQANTHGAAYRFGSVQDCIQGIHLAVGPKESVYIERSSRPVTKTTFGKALGAKRHIRNDELFNAALVSFGSMGLIHSFLIQTEPLFLLDVFRKHVPLDKKLRKTLRTVDFKHLELPGGPQRPKRGYHLQVVINPYHKKKHVSLTTMFKRKYSTGYTPPKRKRGLSPGDDAPAFIGKMASALPRAIPSLVNKLMKVEYADFDRKTGTLGEIFTNTTAKGRAASTALGIPAKDSVKALRLMLDCYEKHGPFAGVASLRYVKGSTALLALTKFPKTCVIELDGLYDERTRTFYQHVWNAFEKSSIPHTFHWGKLNNLDYTRVRRQWGGRLAKWKRARERLLDKKGRYTFSNTLTDRLGLS